MNTIVLVLKIIHHIMRILEQNKCFENNKEMNENLPLSLHGEFPPPS